MDFASDRGLELPGFLQAELTNLVSAVGRSRKSQAK